MTHITISLGLRDCERERGDKILKHLVDHGWNMMELGPGQTFIGGKKPWTQLDNWVDAVAAVAQNHSLIFEWIVIGCYRGSFVRSGKQT